MKYLLLFFQEEVFINYVLCFSSPLLIKVTISKNMLGVICRLQLYLETREYFPEDFVKLLKAPFSQNISGRLLLTFIKKFSQQQKK